MSAREQVYEPTNAKFPALSIHSPYSYSQILRDLSNNFEIS